jgi:double-stranded uracil-DNA glycosylase
VTINNPINTARSHSFPPVGALQPRVLILGSLPGVRSLQAQQYYAHPRNAFWPIMGKLCGFDPALSYGERIKAIADRGIALWDVVHSAVRPGSLDSSLQADSVVVNELAIWLSKPSLGAIALNGATAAKYFRSEPRMTTARLFELPSTSPAHAAMSFADKLQAWHVLRGFLGGSRS